MKKECTKEEALYKAESYCSVSEHCKDDVIRKLEQWGVSPDAHDSIVAQLVKDRFVDEQRYAIAFVRDKYRFSQWGRIKITQALKMKHIASDCISLAIEEVDEEEYLSILTSLLQKKQKSVKGANDYERNGKLIRFAVGHGYEMGEILRCMKRIGCDNEDFE